MAIEILAVDADADGLSSLVDSLQAAGYGWTGAESFEVARGLLKRHRYNLLITTHRLQAYNGLHLVFYGRSMQPDLPAIIIANSTDPTVKQEAERMGAHYVAAPVDGRRLLAVVKAALDGHLAHACS
jgi:DNA-binding NtrC family response regulator